MTKLLVQIQDKPGETRWERAPAKMAEMLNEAALVWLWRFTQGPVPEVLVVVEESGEIKRSEKEEASHAA